MSTYEKQPDPFSYDYQKHFICSYVAGMHDRKLNRVAMYHFGRSRTELAHRTAELVSGDRDKFDDFLRHFPLSWHESLGIYNQILRYSLINGQKPKTETNSYAVKAILSK